MIEISKPIQLDTLLSNINITDKLADKDLEMIGSHVVDMYEMDEESRSDYIDKTDEWIELAMQVTEEKTFPWPGASNVKYPLLATAALQFSARAYPSLIPGVNIVKGKVIGMDRDGTKRERAIRIGKHMSYQILDEMDNWEEDMDRLLFSLPIVGCMFKKTYYDSLSNKNKSEIVYPKELVVNYWATSLESAERITHVLKLTDNDIYERKAEGTYADVDVMKTKVEELVDEEKDERIGTAAEVSGNIEHIPYMILEQHCWIDLDGDGYKEPYIITVDYGTSNVLRIVPRYAQDSIKLDAEGGVITIKADSYFTKFSFIPSPDGGFYDIGFGILLGPINHTINTTINQLLDAGTLSTLQAGFISKGIRIKSGQRSFVPGEWKPVNTTGDDLRKGIVPLPVAEPSNVLFQLLGMMIQSGEKLSSVQDMMTGELPGQNTKATVALASIEQGMKVFSSIYKRVYRSLGKEFKLLFKLNYERLPDEVYFTVLDVGEEEAARIGANDYNPDDLDVRPAADPNVATEQQRLAKVQAIFEILPLGAVNPIVATRRYLEATEQPGIDELMQMPPPKPNPEVIQKAQELALKEREIIYKEFEAYATAMLKIAQAEGVEDGPQLEMYGKLLDELKIRLAAEAAANKEKMNEQSRMGAEQG